MKFSELKPNSTLYKVFLDKVTPVEVKSVIRVGFSIIDFGTGYGKSFDEIESQDMFTSREKAESVLAHRLRMKYEAYRQDMSTRSTLTPWFKSDYEHFCTLHGFKVDYSSLATSI